MSGTKYRLAGAINPRGQTPAICVPAFGSATNNATYVQHIGIDDNVLYLDEIEPSDWERVQGIPRTLFIESGYPAIHWIVWSDDFDDSVINTIDVVRFELLARRWIIDLIENPFERLDFAQLSGQYNWFAEEAEKCESSFSDKEELISWLRDTVLLSRVQFAVDSVLVARSTPSPVRRRLSGRLVADGPDILISHIRALFTDLAEPYVNDSDLAVIATFFAGDVAYRYAVERLFRPGPIPETTPVKPAKWYKKLTVSDAQRKRSGNQRGSITLTKSGFPIDAQTYFRNDLFGSADWIMGKTRTGLPLETASIRFRTMIHGRDLGTLSFTVSYAPNRQADQANYTSLLHLGPLAGLFENSNMAEKWLSLERKSDGSYALTIGNTNPR